MLAELLDSGGEFDGVVVDEAGAAQAPLAFGRSREEAGWWLNNLLPLERYRSRSGLE